MKGYLLKKSAMILAILFAAAVVASGCSGCSEGTQTVKNDTANEYGAEYDDKNKFGEDYIIDMYVSDVSDTNSEFEYETSVHYMYNTITCESSDIVSEIHITKYIGQNTDISIPELIGGHPVTEIGNRAFEDCSEIKSVSMSENITNIGDYAFSGCTGLTQVKLSDSLKELAIDVFSGCTALKEIKIREGVEKIGAGAFEDCTGLRKVNIPKETRRIGGGSFKNCTELESINIPDSVEKIEDMTFYNCMGLKSALIGEGVKDIGNGAFYSCTALTEITVPDSVEHIHDRAFYGCSALTDISVGKGTAKLIEYAYAFAGCTNLRNINIDSENSVLSSEDGVMFDKSKSGLLTCPEGREGAYTVPDSVVIIYKRAFQDCTKLTEVIIPEGVIDIGINSFDGCTGLKSVTIPESVEKLSSGLFSGCTSLESVFIPESVTEIGNYVFEDCDNVTIYGKKGSEAEKYARENNIKFAEK